MKDKIKAMNYPQNQALIRAMKRKRITPLEAMTMGIVRFGARINEIRKVHALDEKWVVCKNGKRVKGFKITAISGKDSH